MRQSLLLSFCWPAVKGKDSHLRERFSWFKIESEIYRRDDKQKRNDVVPARNLPEHQPHDDRKDDNRDAFLHDFELYECKAS